MDNCKAGKYDSFGEYTVHGVDDTDGYKFDLGNDRSIMIRPSGTEPVLRCYGEAENMDEVYKILENVKQTLIS